MKKFGINTRNPNPPWPSEQPVIAVPPGTSAEAVGMPGETVHTMPREFSDGNTNRNENSNDRFAENRETLTQPNEFFVPDSSRRFPLMGNMPYIQPNGSMMPHSTCSSVTTADYLCGQSGKYARLEFMFGDQMHIEKTGILREVGRDFIVLEEAGTGNTTVCPLGKIKFINIYDTDRE